MYQILNEPPWYLLALSPQQFLCCDTLSWWVCSPPQLQIFCVWFLGLGECSHWCYRNMGSWCQYLTLWLQIGETPLLTAFSRRVSGSGKMRKKGGQKQSPAERMRGVRVCCCFMYQPINFLLWPLQVTLSFEASLTTPLVWIVSHHQSADLPPWMPYTNSWPASGLLWWGAVYSCAGGWKAVSHNTDYFWHQGCIPIDLPNHSGPSGYMVTQPITCGEMCLDGLQRIPPLQLNIWFHLSNAPRNEMPEITLILVICLIGLVCGSVEAARSLEQQIEQLDYWIQLLSLHQIVSGTDAVPMPFQVCSCNCWMVKQFLSLKNVPQFWISSSALLKAGY